MERRQRDSVILFVGLFYLIFLTHSANVSIPVGVILDSDSSLGDMAGNCINISLQDFYSTNHSYTTNLTLHFRRSGNDILTAADVARDLINETKVHAILGPQSSEQARFIVELGNKSEVPVIWFSPSGPSLLPPRSRFFIHTDTTRRLCLQFEAIAAIIQSYRWQCVIPIYEEPEFGIDLIPCLTYALQDMDTRVSNASSIRQDFSKDDINEVLNKIKGKRTCVFLAHMTVELWSTLAELAQKENMTMDKGYAWILTQGLSLIDPTAKSTKVKGYMDGVLGLKPSYNMTRLSSSLLATKLGNKTCLSLYGLWAYDTITALATAVEHAGFVNSDVNGVDLPEAIKDTSFQGLSGDFSLRHGQLEPPRFVVYNMTEKREMIIGHWSPEKGFDPNDSVVAEWRGNAKERPPRLRIGVPTKTHFTEFVNANGEGDDISPTGFAVDVFKKVVEALPFPLPHDFMAVNGISHDPTLSRYERLLCGSKDENVDAIIGDITILVNRTKCVDFTMPYYDSSVSMVVKVRSDSKNGWILLEPFDWKLWLILSVSFVGATAIVIILERPMKDDSESNFNHFVRNPFLVYMSDVLSLKRGTSKWAAIVVMFVLSIAVQVYTSNLTPILSERTTAKASTWRDVQEIKRNNVTVGYQSDSWVRELLVNQIGLRENQLKALNSIEQYNEELSKGAREGVDVIIDETPYLYLLLHKCSSCKMTGPIYKAGGFAFAFSKNSPWLSYFSTAILHVTQDATVFRDMKNKIFLPISMGNKSEYNSDVEMRSLTRGDFGGLFPIVYSVLALFLTISVVKVPSVALLLRKVPLLLKKVPPIAFLMKKVSPIALELHNKFVAFLSPSGGVIVARSSN